jgi:hypothetical protein
MFVYQWRRSSAIFCAVIVGVVVSPSNARAAEGVHPFLDSKFVVQAGVFFPSEDFDLRVDGSVPVPENEFDFDGHGKLGRSSEIFAAELTWRFGKKWSLRMQYFGEEEIRSVTLEEDINWGDTIIESGSSVTMGTGFDLVRAFFGRSFDSNPKHEFGAGLGVHKIDISAFIERNVIISLSDVNAVAASGPLPNIGAWYYYSPSEKWYIGGRLDWMEVSFGDYGGGLLNTAAGANYQAWEHVGVGVKYQLFSLNADVKNDNWRGHVKKTFEGLYLYLSGNW